MDYMNKFIDNLPKLPNTEEYRSYLLLRARELAVDSINQEPIKKRNMIEKSMKYATMAKLGEKDILTKIKERFGVEEKASSNTLF